MKRLILAGLAILITCSGGAQKILYSSSGQEILLKNNNKVYYIKILTDSMTVRSGVVVYPDGRIKTSNGIAYAMSDGDCIKCNGQLIVFYQWLDIVNGIKTKRHIMRVWTVLKQPIQLKNGVYALPDGTVRLQSGSYVKLKNKDFLDGDGSGVVAME
jgi:hypothetical protein